jgi:hypothetical protein
MFSFVKRTVLASATALVAGALLVPEMATASPAGQLLASGLQNSIGSTIGPDGALYIAEGDAGRVSRLDLTTGHRTIFARGLPPNASHRLAARWTSPSSTARPMSW